MLEYGNRFKNFLLSFGNCRKAAQEMNKRGIKVTYQTVFNWGRGKGSPSDLNKLKILLAFPEAGLKLEDFFERFHEAHKLFGDVEE